MTDTTAPRSTDSAPEHYRCSCADARHDGQTVACPDAVRAFCDDRAEFLSSMSPEWLSALYPAALSVWAADGFLPARKMVGAVRVAALSPVREGLFRGHLTGFSSREDDGGARGAVDAMACADPADAGCFRNALAAEERGASADRVADAMESIAGHCAGIIAGHFDGDAFAFVAYLGDGQIGRGANATRKESARDRKRRSRWASAAREACAGLWSPERLACLESYGEDSRRHEPTTDRQREVARREERAAVECSAGRTMPGRGGHAGG